MWKVSVILLSLFFYVNADSDEETSLYYYGIEESEHGLRACAARQACGVRARRYWRGAALLRLCRCARRRRCDARAPPDSLVDLNNRASFQFCQPIVDWPYCGIEDTALTVETAYDRMNPDELEQLHHKNVQLVPPKIIFNCKCRTPNYWRIKTDVPPNGAVKRYRCSALPTCAIGEFCGNVSGDLYALYQSCLCPRRSICVHNGGIPFYTVSELLYNGSGWKAYCQSVQDGYNYDDY